MQRMSLTVIRITAVILVNTIESEKKKRVPVGIVHSDCLLSLQYFGFVNHHTRFVESRLPI